MNIQAFISLHSSRDTGTKYLRVYADGVPYIICDAESLAKAKAAVGGVLNKSNLVLVNRTRKDGSTWQDLQIKYPLVLDLQIRGNASAEAKFATITEAKRVTGIDDFGADLNGVEVRTFTQKAKPIAAETADNGEPVL